MARVLRSCAALAAVLVVSVADAGRQVPGSDHLLLQASDAMLARARRRPPMRSRLVLADGQIAQTLQRSRMSPNDLANAVSGGLMAMKVAVTHLTMKPPQIGEGIRAMGKHLLLVVDPVRPLFNNTVEFEEFEREWMQFFEEVPEKVDSVQDKLERFAEEGRPDQLVLAMGEILATLCDGVVKFVPHETATEVVKYVDAVGDIFNAVGVSWVGFESGREVEAIEGLYFGIRAAVEQMVPEDIRNDDTFKLVIGTLDAVVADLSNTVMAFQKQMVEAAVCWKIQGSRQRKRPDVCPDGYLWNGEQFCLPKPSTQSASLISLEASAARILSWSLDQRPPSPHSSLALSVWRFVRRRWKRLVATISSAGAAFSPRSTSSATARSASPSLRRAAFVPMCPFSA